MAPSVRGRLGLGIRLAAAAVWLVAGATKLADVDAFRAEIGAYRLLPAALLSVVAYGLPLLELGLGLYLALGLFTRGAAIAASLLALLLLAAQAQAWARGLAVDCGCFGAALREQVGVGSMLRDLGLAVPGLVMALWPARRCSLDRRFLGRPDVFGATTLVSLRRPRRRPADA